MTRLLFFSLLFCPLLLAAQFVAPQASPPAAVSATIGYTKVTVKYHQPAVRGRKIFGELIPWNEPWRAGANDNTLITFDGAVTIGDKDIPAGTYSLYLVPREFDDWTWVLNSATGNWGTKGYNSNLDLVRVPAEAAKLPAREETLGYRFRNIRPDSAQLTLEWGWKRLALTVHAATTPEVTRRADEHLNPAADPKEYYAAARYYLDNDLDLEQAKRWMDRWAAEDEEQFGRMRYQAIIEHELGNNAAARRLMERSLELATKAGNEHYERMNKRSLRGWARSTAKISADSLLARSIRYHDPGGNWNKTSHRLQLAESRPGGSVRHSRLTLYANGQDFDLQQTRGRDKIQLRLLDGTYTFSHQGRTAVADRDRERLGLTPERTELLRDYYGYLYGLPMKLRDPAARIDPAVHEVWFNDQQVLELRVAYPPEQGNDIWLFKDGNGPATGEYVVLKEEALVDKMKLPAERYWYETATNLYLGADEILR